MGIPVEELILYSKEYNSSGADKVTLLFNSDPSRRLGAARGKHNVKKVEPGERVIAVCPYFVDTIGCYY